MPVLYCSQRTAKEVCSLLKNHKKKTCHGQCQSWLVHTPIVTTRAAQEPGFCHSTTCSAGGGSSPEPQQGELHPAVSHKIQLPSKINCNATKTSCFDMFNFLFVFTHTPKDIYLWKQQKISKLPELKLSRDGRLQYFLISPILVTTLPHKIFSWNDILPENYSV